MHFSVIVCTHQRTKKQKENPLKPCNCNDFSGFALGTPEGTRTPNPRNRNPKKI